MKKLLFSTLFILITMLSLHAQDKHFTQFYAAPLTLNPALTGVFEGKYRVGVIYRDQWRQVLEEPIRTYAMSTDLRFKAPGKRVRQDAIGLGLLFYNDKVNVVDFSTTQIALSLAYHKSLDVSDRHFLTLGLQGGLTQKNVNYESLQFEDQFDIGGQTGFVDPTEEIFPENNISYSDFNVGLNYSGKFGRATGIYAGLALHHFLQPTIAFSGDQDAGDKLYMKVSGQFSANIPIARRVSFQPRFLIAQQGPHMEINTGANFRTAMGQYGSSALHLGGWVRPVSDVTNGIGLDAVVALVGVEYNNVLFGLSYDLNFKALAAKQRQSAFEFSIAYLGSYESEEILCPKF